METEEPMTRGGRAKDRSTPERRCIVTGETGPKAGLIRFAISPEGVVVPDILARLPGRGLWVLAERRALDRAAAKNAFAKRAKARVTVPTDLAAQVETGLVARVAGLLSLARKAGEAVAGLEKAKAWLVDGSASLLIQAADGSPRECARLRPPEEGGKDAHITTLSAAELGLAFGRERVIHAALLPGGLARQIKIDSARLAGVRS